MTTPVQVRVCAFKGLQNLPLFVARQQGFFAGQGLNVEMVYTSGSIPQLSGLVQGVYQLVQTAPDNVANINSNPSTFGLDPAITPAIRMLLGGSTGPLCLYAQSAVANFADLRGAMLGVDNPGSGFALVLRDMLARNGLELERDYRFVVAGGTSARLQALKHGDIAATVLYLPFDLIAAEHGLRRLTASSDYYSAYASLATAGTRDWIETHTDIVISYIVALRQALLWIYDPANAAAVQALIIQEIAAEMDASLAAKAYEAFIDPVIGFGITGRLDEAGLQQVIDLRARYSVLSDAPGTAKEYQDLHWYEEASKKLALPQ
jgi:ABC-type nitrate/sulfonate/bicarbonate transport system substrate-binding protein